MAGAVRNPVKVITRFFHDQSDSDFTEAMRLVRRGRETGLSPSGVRTWLWWERRWRRWQWFPYRQCGCHIESAG